MRWQYCINIIILSLMYSVGCGKDSNVNMHVEEGATGGSILVHVSDGDPLTKPVYTWEDLSGNKTAYSLKVEQITPLTPVWEVISPATQENLTSPVIHAVSQAGTTDTTTGGNLQTDIWYRVVITKGDIITYGSRDFLIKP